MNQLSQIDTFYLRPNRTIEVIKVWNSLKEKIFYVYNYEGYSYRVFQNILELIEFFKNDSEPVVHLESEKMLDLYLEGINIV